MFYIAVLFFMQKPLLLSKVSGLDSKIEYRSGTNLHARTTKGQALILKRNIDPAFQLVGKTFRAFISLVIAGLDPRRLRSKLG